MGSNLDFDISLLLNLSSKQKPPTDLSFNLKAIKLLSLKPIAQIIFTLSENAVLSNEWGVLTKFRVVSAKCCVLCKNKSLIKPQNYTENTEMFNFWVIVIRSFCGSSAEARNCFHIHIIWYIFLWILRSSRRMTNKIIQCFSVLICGPII